VKKKAFSLIELLVAVSLLAVVMVMAGAIFRAAIGSYQVAKANAQILQGLRNITSQLDRDLKGISRQGEVCTVCLTESRSDARSPQGRFDRLVFVASGDFESYKTYRPTGADAGQDRTVRGNTALISYMLALRPKAGDGKLVSAAQIPASRRILARTQHILTPETFEGAIDPNGAGSDPKAWFKWHNRQEYDNFTVVQWSQMKGPAKANALAMLTDTDVNEASLKAGQRGACVDPCDPNSIHMLLCEGVADFSVQGWDENDPNHWVPVADSHGTLAPTTYSGFPGDGRALKFTFTLVDPKGILKQGRTFTHIVYLKD
jgi:prepilin-type N-terminal cleavage/methylation domain-containing protein